MVQMPNKECRQPQGLEESRDQFFFRIYEKNITLPSPWVWTSGTKNHEEYASVVVKTARE